MVFNTLGFRYKKKHQLKTRTIQQYNILHLTWRVNNTTCIKEDNTWFSIHLSHERRKAL